jgi:ABC-type Fe3+/spermidine/putrescine transport system ATPase subunit
MNRGRIEQLGTPADIFDRLATRFVAIFMGMTNLIDGTVAGIDGATVRLDAGGHMLSGAWTGPRSPTIGQSAFLAIHPQRVAIDPLGAGGNQLGGAVLATAYKGAHTDITVDTALGILTASTGEIRVGGPASISLGWLAEDCAVGPIEPSL